MRHLPVHSSQSMDVESQDERHVHSEHQQFNNVDIVCGLPTLPHDLVPIRRLVGLIQCGLQSAHLDPETIR